MNPHLKAKWICDVCTKSFDEKPEEHYSAASTLPCEGKLTDYVRPETIELDIIDDIHNTCFKTIKVAQDYVKGMKPEVRAGVFFINLKLHNKDESKIIIPPGQMIDEAGTLTPEQEQILKDVKLPETGILLGGTSEKQG